jgi:hypothetical protein
MLIRTGLKAGADPEPIYPIGDNVYMTEPEETSTPYMNKWLSCYRCKGTRDTYGNVSKARCEACWPMGAKSPY